MSAYQLTSHAGTGTCSTDAPGSTGTRYVPYVMTFEPPGGSKVTYTPTPFHFLAPFISGFLMRLQLLFDRLQTVCCIALMDAGWRRALKLEL